MYRRKTNVWRKKEKKTLRRKRERGKFLFLTRRHCDRKSSFWKRLTIPQISEGSFSAVSTPIFATRYSFFSIFRDLQDYHSFAPLRYQNLLIFFQNFAKNQRIFEIFRKILLKSFDICYFRRVFHGFCRNFTEIQCQKF